jgi:hypothetical protein
MLDQAVAQLFRFRHAYLKAARGQEPQLVLIVPSALSAQYIADLAEHGVTAIDSVMLQKRVPILPGLLLSGKKEP